MSGNHANIHGVKISTSEFDRLRELILERSGIHLNEHKRALLCARLGCRLRSLGLGSFSQYYSYLTRHDPEGAEMVQMVDAISTNFTDFFREPEHFEFLLKRFFPRWKNTPMIRILSAGCSSGEEPYSVAVCAREFFGEVPSSRVDILAIDISTRVLKQACGGQYPASRLKKIPRHLVSNCFEPVKGSPGSLRVAPSLQRCVRFKHMNLTRPLALNAPFHAIFCRNVSIYFDTPTQNRVFGQLYDALVPGGSLFVGHSESMLHCSYPYIYVQPTIYERPIMTKGMSD